MRCPLSKSDLSDPAYRAICIIATFEALRLLAMSFITFVTALSSVPSGLSTNLFQDALCVGSWGTTGCQPLLIAILQMAQT